MREIKAMSTISIIVMLAAANLSLSSSSNPLLEMILEVLRDTNTDLNVLSDFALPEQTGLMEGLASEAVPFAAFEVARLRKEQQSRPVERCPAIGPPNSGEDWFRLPEDKTHIRRRQIIPVAKRAR